MLEPAGRVPADTVVPGVMFFNRLFGLTLKVSCTFVIAELPVLVKVMVNVSWSPRLRDVGPAFH